MSIFIWNVLLKQHKLVRLRRGAAVSFSAVLLAGCSAEPSAVPNTDTPAAVGSGAASTAVKAGEAWQASSSAAASGSGSAQSSAFRHPLTGLPIDADVAARPLMVMVNNHPAARPQSGLSSADVLVECLAEGEITRIVAFYQGSSFPGKIGPVRSIRPYYIDIGRMYDAIDIHAGGSPDAYTILEGGTVDHLDEITNAGKFFWRESFRKAPHNLYTDLDHLHAGVEKLGFRTELKGKLAVAFASDQADRKGEAAAHLDVTFLIPSYKVSYDYDTGRGVYLRSINGKAHTDLNNGEQLSAANVLVLGADHKVLDSEGRRDVKLTGSGEAMLLQKGVVVKGTWQRKEAGEAFRFVADDGHAVGLLPGQTHYLVVPNAPSFEQHVKL